MCFQQTSILCEIISDREFLYCDGVDVEFTEVDPKMRGVTVC